MSKAASRAFLLFFGSTTFLGSFTNSVGADLHAGSVDPEIRGQQELLKGSVDKSKYLAVCPDYKNYAMRMQYVTAPQITRKLVLTISFQQSSIQPGPNEAPISATITTLPHFRISSCRGGHRIHE